VVCCILGVREKRRGWRGGEKKIKVGGGGGGRLPGKKTTLNSAYYEQWNC